MENFNEVLDHYKLPILLSVVGLVLIIGGLFSSGLVNFSQEVSSTDPKQYQSSQASVVKPDEVKGIKVDISGAVIKPGVYSLPAEARVEDLVKLAGGFDSSASAEFIAKNLNLSQKLADSQKFYIPYQGEAVAAIPVVGQAQVAGISTSSKVGINSGTSTELESLTGVGPVTASKIIAKRPYQDLNELVNKKVISKNLFEKIKEQIELR